MSLDNNQAKGSLKFSSLDGIFVSGMVGFTQEYFTPFLILLAATVSQVSIFNANHLKIVY